MLAGWLQVTVEPAPGGGGLGMIVDGSNNSIQDLAENGPAALAGVALGDLLVSLDGTTITDFEGHDGPVEGTVMVTGQPTSIMGAHAALDGTRPTHQLLLLRAVDPSSVGEHEIIRPPEPMAAPSPPNSHPPSYSHPPPSQQQSTPQHPLEHYPWATAIQLPDATFGRAAGDVKTKYNLAVGTMLPPMQQIQTNSDSYHRKAQFQNDRSLFRTGR